MMRKEEKIAKAVMEALEQAMETWKEKGSELRSRGATLGDIARGKVYMALKDVGFKIDFVDASPYVVQFYLHDSDKVVFEVWGDPTTRSVEVRKLRVVGYRNFIFNK